MEKEEAKRRLDALEKENKYETMVQTAAIITKMLEKHGIKPIVVGGLSVEIYTQSDYTTRDIDFVSEGFERIKELLLELEFDLKGRYFYREDKEIVVEIPHYHLEGSMDRVVKVYLADNDDLYFYLISIEDIIIDRLRAMVHWKSEDDGLWGFKMLVSNLASIDISYIKNQLKNEHEKKEFDLWLNNVEE